jgi:ferritin-like metal-binding protein YciE
MIKSSTKKATVTLSKKSPSKRSNGNIIVKKMDVAIKKHAIPKKRISVPEPNEDSKRELKDLFEEELAEIFWAEKMLGTLLTGLIKRVKSEVLSQALEENLAMSKEHLEKLTLIYERVELKIPSRKVEIVDYTLRSAKEAIEKGKNKKLDEIRIHFSLRKLRYYRLASYSLLMALAMEMNEGEIVDIIEDLERREWKANDLLTKILLFYSNSGESQKVYSTGVKSANGAKVATIKKHKLN